MARTVRDSALDTRTARSRLKVSGKPYYRAIDAGLHLGYRKGKTGGRWVMRWYAGAQKYQVDTIGTADDILDADGAAILNFSQAQAIARKRSVEQRRAQEGLPTDTGPYTIRRCMADYVAWLAANRKTAADAKYRIDAIILPALGDIECHKLTKPRIEKWLNEAADTPPRLRSKPGKKQKFRPAPKGDEAKRRRRATINRTLTVLKAALNRAWGEGMIASDTEWRRVKPFKEADAARVRYFTVEEAKRLINASGADFRRVVQAALATGARYGELAALNVEDFKPDSGTLQVRTSKSGKPRHIVLADEGIKFFASVIAGRAANEIMLPKDDGERWGASHQNRRMKAACKAGKINPAASIHVLRHTWASLSVMNGAPLMVVAKNLGHSDTRMVEKHYGHLAPSFIADAIRAAAPKFGIKADKTISKFAARAG